MDKLEQMKSDFELLMSVGSHRPSLNAGLVSIWLTPNEIRQAQTEFDAGVAEMQRRKTERGFSFEIPR